MTRYDSDSETEWNVTTCEICGVPFPSKRSERMHRQQTHDGEPHRTKND